MALIEAALIEAALIEALIEALIMAVLVLTFITHFETDDSVRSAAGFIHVGGGDGSI